MDIQGAYLPAIQGFRDNLTNPGIMSFSVLQMLMLDLLI